MKSLSQSRGLLRVKSEIRPEGVFYQERGVLSAHEVVIPFERIGMDTIRVFHVSRLYLAISGFFLFAFTFRLYRWLSGEPVTFGSVGWSTFLALVPTLGTWMNSPHYVGYPTTMTPLLFFEKSGAEDPTEYLKEIRNAREAYLRRTYSPSDVPDVTEHLDGSTLH